MTDRPRFQGPRALLCMHAASWVQLYRGAAAAELSHSTARLEAYSADGRSFGNTATSVAPCPDLGSLPQTEALQCQRGTIFSVQTCQRAHMVMQSPLAAAVASLPKDSTS